jgi:alpha/beta superfamily hydrolase
MVERGQVLERMTVVDGPGGPLEALWQSGGVGREKAIPVLVCPPHPRLGGSMDSAVLAEIVWHLARRGHPTLRFNFSGVSASRGAMALPPLPSDDVVDVAPLVEDARAAAQQLRASTAAREVGVVGVSIGAVAAARLALEDDDVSACALVAPLIAPGLRALAKHRGAGAEAGAAIDLPHLAGGHTRGCPVLVVLGSADRFVDVEAGRAACEAVGLAAITIEGADHGFARGLTQTGRAVADHFGSHDDM